ncbi:GATOR complex protein WDR24-like [Drosophila ananassae]|uniref:GATOR complex protein WDR24-like n=1 Tax=Drosophila ananassae TaxID=7217 RepID=UPI001CFFF445|nr:GATOR complex protein WDR24-like [Drosophila ananassae]
MSTKSRNYLETIINQKEDGDGSNGEDEYEEDLELENNEENNDEAGGEEGVKNNDKAGGEGNDEHGGETEGKASDKNESKSGGDRSGKDGGKRNSKDGDESSSKDGGENNNNDGGEGEDKDENYARNDRNEAGSSAAKVSASEEMKKGNVAKSKLLEFHNPSIDISLGMATQVVTEFSGETCARKWITQMNNIATIYGINGQYVKMLMISKIKEKANVWLHANPERIMLPLEELSAELISKLEARRQFENRKWSSGESFGSYVDDKVMLHQRINIHRCRKVDKSHH